MATSSTQSELSTQSVIRRRKNCRSLRRRDGLIKYAKNNTSQCGEDGIIARIFNDILPPSNERYCVDVGAWDGQHLSNTYSLLVGDGDDDNGTTKQWNGVLIEADPSRFVELKRLHGPLDNICICEEVSSQPTSPQSLISILKREAPHLPCDFDFLSIDVDGMDYWLLADILGASVSSTNNVHVIDKEGRYQPKVICIEFNPTMPTDLIYIQPRDDIIRHGSSLSALVELANAADYTLVETTLFNAFFVQHELYEKYFMNEVPDTSIESLHEITMGTEVYQLYDGTIKLWGCKKMLWHRLPMDEQKMQILPAKDRQFPFAPGLEGADAQLKSEQIRDTAIDMSSYCQSIDESSADITLEDRKRECFTKLNNALQTDGFALVRGTGIATAICSGALLSGKSFLHEADESVRRSCLTKDRARRGYSPMSTENFASLIGQQRPNDLVKKFRIGPESTSDDTTHSPLSSLHQPNSWPNEETWDTQNATQFKSSVEEYFERTRHAADCILKAICDGIIANNPDISTSIKVLSESTNEKNHTSILTLLGYQPGSRHKKGSKGYMKPLVSAHTDVGVITMLLFDNGKCASLQRAASYACSTDPDNVDWIDVDLPLLDDDPIFVVNVGDCLSELSGGSLRSTLHRVIPRPCPTGRTQDVTRTCLALFVGLEPSASLSLPSGEVISYEQWRKRRIARAAAVLKSN